MTAKTYPTILKLISGALIGGAKYEDVYMESEDDNENNGTDDNQTTPRLDAILRNRSAILPPPWDNDNETAPAGLAAYEDGGGV
jgi:hypothetical protein